MDRGKSGTADWKDLDSPSEARWQVQTPHYPQNDVVHWGSRYIQVQKAKSHSNDYRFRSQHLPTRVVKSGMAVSPRNVKDARIIHATSS